MTSSFFAHPFVVVVFFRSSGLSLPPSSRYSTYHRHHRFLFIPSLLLFPFPLPFFFVFLLDDSPSLAPSGTRDLSEDGYCAMNEERR